MNMSDLEGVKTKVCSKCKIDKPVEGFYKAKNSKDGLHNQCKICRVEKDKEYYTTNSDKIKERQKKYTEANSDKIKERNKEYRKANYDKIKEYLKANSENIKERMKEYTKEYRKANSDKIKEYWKEYRKTNPEKVKECVKEYRKSNPDKINAYNAKRRSKKLQATPPWLTNEHLSAIRMYYTESKALEKATGIKHHVDHIVPLQGNNVCGLHVPWNLQVLPSDINLAKSNKHG